MGDKKRMIDNWEVLQAIHIGDKEVLLLHEPMNVRTAYFVCYYQPKLGLGLESTSEGVSSSDYLEMMAEFLRRAQGQIDRVQAELESSNEPREVLGREHCLPLDCSEGDLDACVVVMNPSVFQREYRNAASQLVYITDGFGMFANTRDSAIYGHNVFSGKPTKLCRQFIFGVLDPAKAPDWVKPGMEALRAKLKAKGGKEHER